MAPVTAHWCQCCDLLDYGCETAPCRAGHRPRRYAPEKPGAPFGYRRRCGDYVEARLQPVWVLRDRAVARIRAGLRSQSLPKKTSSRWRPRSDSPR